ncbi:MAG TPA: 16S rRNA (cytidine(1402)-2'-O)-methyltransferase [Burkholderiaceae bacterium]|nr:16S rRNA (cytidine(1402)-2'-O)-methyltransferase [Burkholderiaceae bacterium]
MRQSSEPRIAPHVWDRLTERVDAQDWPAPALYVVATPIGNLADLGLRAWQALRRCDVIAAEDTRTSRKLLDAWGVETPLVAAHKHNEARVAMDIVARLEQGERVAMVSDAGAPAVSDPGSRIVRRVREAGFRIVPIPGPSAVIAALMASGVTTDENPTFVFAGFVPSRSAARKQWLNDWCFLSAPTVMFESPHRLSASVSDIAEVCGPERLVTLARELTKRFEQIETLPAGELPGWLSEDPRRAQGEFVLIVHAPRQSERETASANPGQAALADALLESLSVRDTAKVLAKVTPLSRDDAYKLALERSNRNSAS